MGRGSRDLILRMWWGRCRVRESRLIPPSLYVGVGVSLPAPAPLPRAWEAKTRVGRCVSGEVHFLFG